MMQVSASFDRKDPRGGYIVSAPQDHDAMGAALRAVFCDDRRLPRDMQSALDAIERKTARR